MICGLKSVIKQNVSQLREKRDDVFDLKRTRVLGTGSLWFVSKIFVIINISNNT